MKSWVITFHVCNINVVSNHKALTCSLCNHTIHIKCNKTNYDMFETHKNTPGPIFCIKCQEEIIPFQKVSDQQFYMALENGINNDVDLSNLFISSQYFTQKLF